MKEAEEVWRLKEVEAQVRMAFVNQGEPVEVSALLVGEVVLVEG